MTSFVTSVEMVAWRAVKSNFPTTARKNVSWWISKLGALGKLLEQLKILYTKVQGSEQKGIFSVGLFALFLDNSHNAFMADF